MKRHFRTHGDPSPWGDPIWVVERVLDKVRNALREDPPLVRSLPYSGPYALAPKRVGELFALREDSRRALGIDTLRRTYERCQELDAYLPSEAILPPVCGRSGMAMSPGESVVLQCDCAKCVRWWKDWLVWLKSLLLTGELRQYPTAPARSVTLQQETAAGASWERVDPKTIKVLIGEQVIQINGEKRTWLFESVANLKGQEVMWDDIVRQDFHHFSAELVRTWEDGLRESAPGVRKRTAITTELSKEGLRVLATRKQSLIRAGGIIRSMVGAHWRQDGTSVTWRDSV